MPDWFVSGLPGFHDSGWVIIHLRKTREPTISREQRPQVPTLEASKNFPEHLLEKSHEQTHQQSCQQSHKRSHEQPPEQPQELSHKQFYEQSHEPPSQVEVLLRRSEHICQMPAHLRDYVLTQGLWTEGHLILTALQVNIHATRTFIFLISLFCFNLSFSRAVYI